MSGTLWATLIGMFLATFLTRASFLVFGHRLRFPPVIVQALGHVPIAVLTAIVVPEAIAPGGELHLSLANPYLVGTVVAGLTAWKSGRLLLAVVVGFSVFGALRWLV